MLNDSEIAQVHFDCYVNESCVKTNEIKHLENKASHGHNIILSIKIINNVNVVVKAFIFNSIIIKHLKSADTRISKFRY